MFRLGNRTAQQCLVTLETCLRQDIGAEGWGGDSLKGKKIIYQLNISKCSVIRAKLHLEQSCYFPWDVGWNCCWWSETVLEREHSWLQGLSCQRVTRGLGSPQILVRCNQHGWHSWKLFQEILVGIWWWISCLSPWCCKNWLGYLRPEEK